MAHLKKPFLGGTVRKEVHDTFKEEAESLGITQSKLLDMILADYFSIEPMPLDFDTRNGETNGKASGTS